MRPARVNLVNLVGDYPVGLPDPAEPSGFAPPGPHALVGFTLSHVFDFNGSTVPAGWNVFTGIDRKSVV